MKKSLSVILSSAMALSMFSSVAFGATTKTSADFTDLKDLTADQKVKFDAMISAGIFDGVADGKFGLNDKMNRAQFAKVAALIFKLDVDTTLKTSSFTDVKIDDAANGYALPYIEAVKKAGITDGFGEGIFNPAGDVTQEQLAAFLIRGLGKDAEAKATPGVADKTVSDWAKSYVAYALASKLVTVGADGTFGGTTPAIRSLLVAASFGAQAAYVPPAGAKTSVTKAEATGVKTVTVTFNKAVDDTKATVALTKGTVAVATTTKFADDKKSAVLTLTDSKIGAADYTVTLAGLDATTIATATAKFTGVAESVSKIEFVSANDTLAYSASVSIKVKATNQYGEAASVGNSQFTAFVNGTQATLTGSDGNLTIKTVTNTTYFVQGQSMIPVTVYYNDTRVSATKTFKLGTAPFLSKVEAGTVKYSNGGAALSAKNDTATIPLSLFDQYGNPIVQAQTTGTPAEISASTINAIVAPFSQNVVYDTTAPLFDTDGNAQIVIKLGDKEDKTQDYNVTIYAGSSSATAKVAVSAAKLATKIDFGSFSGNVAAGDTKTFYVPLVATDASGNTLSAQDIVDNYNMTPSRFTFSGSNTFATPTIEQFGENKGKLKFTLNAAAKARGTVYLTALIASANANSYAQTNISVQEQRYPDHIVVDTAPAAKAIGTASADFKYLVKDQYNDTFTATGAAIPNANAQTANYQVVVTLSGDTATSGISIVDKATVGTISTYNNTTKTQTYATTLLNDFNQGFKFTSTAGSTGKVTFKAVIQKNGADFSNTLSNTIEAVKPDTALTYSLDTINTLYSVKDKLALINTLGSVDTGIPAATGGSFFQKKLAVIAKDSAGNTVKLPANEIRGLSSSNQDVVSAVYDNTGKEGYILGNKAGTATVTAIVYTNVGTTVVLTKEVTVKADAIEVAAITSDNTTAKYTGKTNAYDLFGNLDVKDQYGVEYKNANIASFYSILGVNYTVSDVKGGGTVTLDAKTGAFTIDGTVNEFIVTVTAPNGKSKQVLVTQ